MRHLSCTLVAALCLVVVVRSWKDTIIEGLRKSKGREGIMIDVGANGGKQTRLGVEAGFDVLALECLSSAYQHLLSKYSIGWGKQVNLVHVCAGSTFKLMDLHLADDSSSLIPGNVKTAPEAKKALRKHNAERKTETVLVVPIDHFVKNDTKVAFIKIDTQGYEYEVLKGAEELIKRDKPVIMYEDMKVVAYEKNYAGWTNVGDCETFLKGLGYTCVDNGKDTVNDKLCEYKSK